MKRIAKISGIIMIILITLMSFSSVYAADKQIVLNVIQKSSGEKYLENDQGYISKSIVDSNAKTGEVTVELKLSNTKKDTEQTQVYENTEIYMLVSENIVNNEEKLSKNINNIKTLSSKIFEANSKTKIGIIGITGTVRDTSYDENGKLIIGDKDEGTIKGSASNAEIVIGLTDNVDTLISGLQNMNSSKTTYNNNLQAAIRLANKSYSNNTNKILISLYDNVPSVAIGVQTQVSYGGLLSEYSTMEEAVIAKHEKIATYTRNEILTLKTSNVSFILLRPDDTSYDETWYKVSTGEKELDFDGSPYVKELYGTIDNPTYGKMYMFDDSSIDTIVTENIYQDVKEIIQPNINSVKIVDYFPEDIVQNFEFSYVSNPSVGIVSESIDTSTNTIEWDVGELKNNEVTTLRYKLKIKDMNNQELLGKTIATNEKIVLTYKDINDIDYTVTLASSPKIQLSEVAEEQNNQSKTDNTNTPKGEDNTTATGKLPQTGVSATIVISIIAVIIIAIITYKKYYTYKDIK